MQFYTQYFLIVAAIWGVVAMALLLTAWWCAHQRRCKWHRRLMLFLTIGAWLFIINYMMIRYYIPGSAPPVIPRHLILWFAIHGTMGMFLLILVTLVVWSRVSQGRWFCNLHQHLNRRHILYGRILVVVWTLTHIVGMVNYYLLN
ncbi:MAG TPA: DUF420 domain-containing protein [Thermodesulfobacteriota bacterium]|nr:DUF420 domain-containing protein [Thermodesulfobacteriota bacterium]